MSPASLSGRAAMAVCLLLALGCASSLTRTDTRSLVVHSIGADYANVHLVRGPAGVFLIDAGTAEAAPALAARIAELGIDLASIGALILTHGHADHAGGARYFRERFGIPIVAGAGDRPMLAAGANDPLCPTDLIGRINLARAQRATYPPTIADTEIAKPTALSSLAGTAWADGRIVPLPAHTPGSMAVVVGEVAFVGDLLRGAVLGTGAREHFYQCEPEKNWRLLEAFVEGEARAVRTFFTGHFGPVSREAVLALIADHRTR